MPNFNDAFCHFLHGRTVVEPDKPVLPVFVKAPGNNIGNAALVQKFVDPVTSFIANQQQRIRATSDKTADLFFLEVLSVGGTGN